MTKIKFHIKFILDEIFFVWMNVMATNIERSDGCRKTFMQNDSNRFAHLDGCFPSLHIDSHNHTKMCIRFSWVWFAHWTLLSSIYLYLCNVYIYIGLKTNETEKKGKFPVNNYRIYTDNKRLNYNSVKYRLFMLRQVLERK